MKKSFLVASLVGAMSALAGMVAYQATDKNTPQSGYSGEIVGIQACSTHATGTATISSITDLNIGGRTVPFTNQLATVTLSNGVASLATNGIYVASRQRIVVSGSAFPGGSIIVWIKE